MGLESSFSVISDAVGFALMKKPDILNSAYERSPTAQNTREGLGNLRTVLKTVKPAAYRGVERCPLSEDPLPEPGWAGHIADADSLERRDKKARDRLIEILGSNHQCDYSPCCLVPTLANAQELMDLVDSANDYEIVRLSKALPKSFCSEPCDLGFDIGYWGGGNFSILCDSTIWPVWHGPDANSFNDLARVLAALNYHSLFPDYESADRFRDYYRREKWAEVEDQPGEFCIIKVAHLGHILM